MFQKLVSNLSFSPGVGAQMAYYLRRLKKEQISRRLSAIAATLAIVFQIMNVAAAPPASNAASTNDIVFGGLQSGDPRSEILNIYNSDSDGAGHFGFRALFDHFGIGSAELSNTSLSNIDSADPNLLSLGRNHNFAVDVPITVTGGNPPSQNPYGCDHSQISQGSNGDCTKHLQWYLNHKFGYGLAEDGLFGPLTNNAVRDFQSRHGLAVDGIVGPNTWGGLHGQASVVQSNTQTYYQRPLNSWDTGHSNIYPVLVGRRRDGSVFFVMLACGNIVIRKTSTPPPSPSPTPTPPPTPTPSPTPSPSPSPTPRITPTPSPHITPTPLPSPTPTPPPPPPGTPNQSKTAVYLNRNGANGQPLDANGTTAQPGDSIRYTLTTSNNGAGAIRDYQPVEQINDILEYADVIDPTTAIQGAGTLTWPKQTILPHSNITNTFVVRVKSPVPVIPQSVSDPLSFDLRIDNTYGNEVHIKITAPPVKQIELAAHTLPDTGPATSLLTLGFLLLVLYFYSRNRQLIREVQILKVDHNPGV